MDTTKWRSVAIRKEIAYAIKRLQDDLEQGRLNDVPKS